MPLAFGNFLSQPFGNHLKHEWFNRIGIHFFHLLVWHNISTPCCARFFQVAMIHWCFENKNDYPKTSTTGGSPQIGISFAVKIGYAEVAPPICATVC